MAPVEDQGKDMAVLEIRVGIPVRGFNALGQLRLIEEFISDLRTITAKAPTRPIVTVIDRVEIA